MLSEGQAAPAFELQDHEGNPVRLSDFEGSRLVVYFYPKAKTGGCTREARGFRDAYEAFRDRGVAVVGVSTDPVDLIAEFAEEESLPFPLLSDLDGEVAEAYGTRRDSGKAERNTFLVGPDGTVERVYEDVSPDGHPERILEDVDGLEEATA